MTVATAVEQVLVVPTMLFHEVGYFQGFCPNSERYLNTLLDPAYTSYQPRDQMELDPSYKQLIPYCVFRFGDQIFSYRRDKGQGESRLLGKKSIGIGGHISTVDEAAGGSSYLEGMRREIEEEVWLEAGYRHRCVGLINDDLTEVGKVHLGIVHIFDLDAPQVRPREQSIIQTGFATPTELNRERDQFETWSQICLDYLLAAN